MKSVTKHVIVRQALRDRVGKDYPVGTKIPSSTDLQESLGVSQGTIERAIRDLVNEGLLDRVKGQGTFVLGANRDTGMTAFLFPGSSTGNGVDTYLSGDILGSVTLDDPYVSLALRGCADEAKQLGRSILVGDHAGPTEIEQMAQQGGGKIDSVISVFDTDSEVTEAYREQGIRVIAIEPFVRSRSMPYITSDNYVAAREVITHLSGHGHQRIVHVSIDFPIWQVAECKAGYEQAMLERGLASFCHTHKTPFRQYALRTPDGFQLDGSIHNPETLRDNEDYLTHAEKPFVAMLTEIKPTALWCFHDEQAAWVMALCHKCGIRIPADISIVGSGDTGLAERLWPPLTTLRRFPEALGRAAMRMVAAGPQSDPLAGLGTVMPVRLVERGSSGKLIVDS